MVDATIDAVIKGLRWAADGIEAGRLGIISVHHEREMKDDAMIGLIDTDIRVFNIRYIVLDGPKTMGGNPDVNQGPKDSLRRVSAF